MGNSIIITQHFHWGKIISNVYFQTDNGKNSFHFELPPAVWTYGAITSAIVRLKYSQNQVEAIISNHIIGDEDDEFEAFKSWRIFAKAKAKEIIEYAKANDIFDYPNDYVPTTTSK